MSDDTPKAPDVDAAKGRDPALRPVAVQRLLVYRVLHAFRHGLQNEGDGYLVNGLHVLRVAVPQRDLHCFQERLTDFLKQEAVEAGG